MMRSHGALNGRTLCVITGTTDCFCVNVGFHLANTFAAGSCILLIDSDGAALERLRNWLVSKQLDIHIALCRLDLAYATTQQLHALFTYSFLGAHVASYECALLLVSWHGRRHDDLPRHLRDADDVSQLRSCFAANLAAPFALTSVFVHKCHQLPQKFVVAVDRQSTGGIDCIVKSARQTFIRCLADENADLRVLNYTIPANRTCNVHARGKVGSSNVNVQDHASRCDNGLSEGLIKVLQENRFDSGAVVQISHCGPNNYVIDYSFLSQPSPILRIGNGSENDASEMRVSTKNRRDAAESGPSSVSPRNPITIQTCPSSAMTSVNVRISPPKHQKLESKPIEKQESPILKFDNKSMKDSLMAEMRASTKNRRDAAERADGASNESEASHSPVKIATSVGSNSSSPISPHSPSPITTAQTSANIPLEVILPSENQKSASVSQMSSSSSEIDGRIETSQSETSKNRRDATESVKKISTSVSSYNSSSPISPHSPSPITTAQTSPNIPLEVIPPPENQKSVSASQMNSSSSEIDGRIETSQTQCETSENRRDTPESVAKIANSVGSNSSPSPISPHSPSPFTTAQTSANIPLEVIPPSENQKSASSNQLSSSSSEMTRRAKTRQPETSKNQIVPPETVEIATQTESPAHASCCLSGTCQNVLADVAKQTSTFEQQQNRDKHQKWAARRTKSTRDGWELDRFTDVDIESIYRNYRFEIDINSGNSVLKIEQR